MLVIEQEIFTSIIFILQIESFFLVILTLHNSKTTCGHRKPIVDLESTSENTSKNKKKNKKINE